MFGSPKKKKIFILLGHPDADSFNRTLADEYQTGAEKAGHEVRRMNLGELKFDPILHHGYRVIQELEPDLRTFQENVNWAEHFVIFYPSWWATMPALLKGLFDRVWIPGFAYKFTGEFSWIKLMKGKTARVFVTSDTIPFAQWLLFGDTTNEIAKGILGFSGFKVKVKKYGYLKHFWSMARRERIKRRVNILGNKAK
jgi:NAD(P)H dehydrogenase (quinone)